MARRPDKREALDELDRLLSDPDLLGDEEEIELALTEVDLGRRADRETVRALVEASPTLTASVRDARAACQTARDALARARDEVDRVGALEAPPTADVLAWLACMDELVRFADSVGQVLSD
jgi:hypothetical protein